MNEKPKAARYGEGAFCVIYLVFILTAAIIMRLGAKQLYNPDTVSLPYLKLSFGFMLAILLGGGDAFHLIPRIIFNFKGSLPKKNFLFGLGNLVSSITMTVFYDILMSMGDSLEYHESMYNLGIENAILILTIIRIILLLFPQNKWYSGEENVRWAIIRNVPFALIGILTIVGYINVIHHRMNYPLSMYVQIIIAVALSFSFYLPVAIKGKSNPKLGMLMIPKTICYMWLITLIMI